MALVAWLYKKIPLLIGQQGEKEAAPLLYFGKIREFIHNSTRIFART